MATQGIGDPPAPLNAGEVFLAIIFAACPTAMARGLAVVADTHKPSLQNWADAIKDHGGDTPEVNQTMQDLVLNPRYEDLFKALLTKESSVVPATKLYDQIAAFTRSSPMGLSLGWSGDPHPGSQDALRLMEILQNFREESNVKS